MNKMSSTGVPETKRAAGVLLHITSLPGPYGVGTLGAEALRFADFLQAAGQRCWQVLPVGPTGEWHSPYQSPSAFAGSPLLIDPELLCRQGLLRRSECAAVSVSGESADFDRAEEGAFKRLHAAFARHDKGGAAYRAFCKEQDFWLSDYALFMALKEHFGGAPWNTWEAGVRRREAAALAHYQTLLKEETEFWKFVQYLFFFQWSDFKEYVNQKGLRLIGDIPLYVSGDSVDTWVNRALFRMDEDGNAKLVGGVPPDDFTEEGQNWNVPVYHWAHMAEEGFAWWKARMAAAAERYDMVRIDHFIGIGRYYAIPGEGAPASAGVWRKGPGMKLMRAIGEVLPWERLIAEDLGVPLPETEILLRRTGLPSMKVLEFAFDGEPGNAHLPHNLPPNCAVYGGTHDNETVGGFLARDAAARRAIARYLGRASGRAAVWDVIRMGLASVADRAVFQMQDYLELGNEARMNTPGTIGGQNWRWRMREDAADAPLAQRMRDMARQYDR